VAIFLGIDVGGSKTHALLSDEMGNILGFGETGPGNHESVGYDGLVNAMQLAFQQAAATENITAHQIQGAGFGIAGYDWPSEKQDTLNAIIHLGLNCPIEVANDAVLGLYAGSENGWGVNLIAGTSNNCYGRDQAGKEGRVTGAGMLFGEFGGAIEIVVKAVQAVNYQWIRRGPETQLSQRFMEMTGASTLTQLMENMVMEVTPIHPLWAIEVLEAAAQGDSVAQGVIEWAGLELAELAKAVIRQLSFGE
jgi:N-acetylglucosamine kinase-like BadF-type ATPase